MNYFETINKRIIENNGYIRTSDVVSMNVPTVYLTRYVRSRGLNKLAAGFYADKNWLRDDFYLFQCSYPKFIYSLYSAIYLHHLGDIKPLYYEVTGPKNYRPLGKTREDVKNHTDTKEETYGLGITEIETPFGNKVKVYDLEKTICDLVRFKKDIELEVFLKAFRRYSKRKDKNIIRLFRYARVMGIEEKVMSFMEIFLNEDK